MSKEMLRILEGVKIVFIENNSKPKNMYVGLCDMFNLMKSKGRYTTWEQAIGDKVIFKEYLCKTMNVIDCSWYLWDEEDSTSRLEWLDKHIKLNS